MLQRLPGVMSRRGLRSKKCCQDLRNVDGILLRRQGASGRVSGIGMRWLKIWIGIARCWCCGCWKRLRGLEAWDVRVHGPLQGKCFGGSLAGGLVGAGDHEGPPRPASSALAPTVRGYHAVMVFIF